MVRLRERYKTHNAGLFVYFQFQYGAVKSGKLYLLLLELLSFNSNMVRLRGAELVLALWF